MALLPLLRPTGETVSGALARLGVQKRRRAKRLHSDDSSKTHNVKKPKKDYGREAAAALAEAEGGNEVSQAAEAMDVDGATNPAGARIDAGQPAAVVRPKAKGPKDPIDQKISDLTDLASTLTGIHGETDAYDLTHGAIVGILKSEGAVRRNWEPPSADDDPDLEDEDGSAAKPAPTAANGSKRPLIARPSAVTSVPSSASFQYRFKPSPTVSAAQSSQVYGPFGKDDMRKWADGGYFGPQGAHIDVRRQGSDEWVSWAEATR